MGGFSNLLALGNYRPTGGPAMPFGGQNSGFGVHPTGGPAMPFGGAGMGIRPQPVGPAQPFGGSPQPVSGGFGGSVSPQPVGGMLGGISAQPVLGPGAFAGGYGQQPQMGGYGQSPWGGYNFSNLMMMHQLAGDNAGNGGF